MLKSLKQLIDSRLGINIAIDDMDLDNAYFIKLKPAELTRAAHFLKHDPDTNLALFHQMMLIPSGILQWPRTTSSPDAKSNLLYQLKSLKLPYEVTLVVEVLAQDDQIPSLSELYFGARFFEKDIGKKIGVHFESSHKNFLSKRGTFPW